MTVKRVMGTETEYAISAPGQNLYNCIQLSHDLIRSAAQLSSESAHIRWDYASETPMHDARGFHMERKDAHPSQLTDAPQLRATNVLCANGGRIYVDHAHPEYSAPETTDPFEALLFDKAGDLLMFAAAEAFGGRKAAESAQNIGQAKCGEQKKYDRHAQSGEYAQSDQWAKCSRIELHKNNVDGKGASWGNHENYSVKRSVPFELIACAFTAHAVSRQIYCGSGRVGIGEKSEIAGFQLSQRADYMQSKIGLQTTFERPIVNTRDESHAGDEYRRFHVIASDANLAQVPAVLKLGTTSLILWAVEQYDNPALSEAGVDVADLFERLALADPVEAFHAVSRDLTFKHGLALEGGSKISSSKIAAWQLQVRLLNIVFSVGAAVYGADSCGQPLWPDESTRKIIDLWQQVLRDIARISKAGDDERLKMSDEASRLEWLLKWQVLESLRRRIIGSKAAGCKTADCKTADRKTAGCKVSDAENNGVGNDGAETSNAETSNVETESVETVDDKTAGWDDARLAAADLAWSSLDKKKSLFAKVANRSKQFFDGETIFSASQNAPLSTRAWLRGRLIKYFPQYVYSASWKRIVLKDFDKKNVGCSGADSRSNTDSCSGAGSRSNADNCSNVDNCSFEIDCSNPLDFRQKDCALDFFKALEKKDVHILISALREKNS